MIVLLSSTGADAQVKTRDKVDPATAAMAEAAKQGLVMKGYRDTEGLVRILEHHFKDASLFGVRAQADRRLVRAPADRVADRVAEIAEAFREAGIDPEIMRGMESLVRGMDVSIYRVEFVPGFTGLDVPGAPNTDPGSQGGLEDDGGLTPGIPRGQSLVASSDRTYSVYHRYADGYTQEKGYRDGSTWYHAEGRTANGNYMYYDRVTNQDGSTRYSSLLVTDPETGDVQSHSTQRQEGGAVTEAEKDHQRTSGYQHPDDEGPNEENVTNEGEDTGGEQGAGEGEGDLDQYQPAGGGEGTFCPLILEHCRRALAEMVESKDDILIGTVLVNPGDPDEQPEGSRLVYDPENLVINPNPETVRGEARQLGSRRFWMSMPVWVNPPGPNEP